MASLPEDKQSRLLIIGCGNSSLGHDLYEDGGGGYKNIDNIDYSAVVIERMAKKYGD